MLTAHIKATSLALGIAVVLASVRAFAQDDNPGYPPGPWHYKAIPCVNTTVKEVHPRLADAPTDFESGVVVVFNTTLGADPAYPPEPASVAHYQGTPGNEIMSRERRGDRVQVCFMGPPAPSGMCDPDKDWRGRSYRVYDYRRHAQYWGTNSQHGCGGA